MNSILFAAFLIIVVLAPLPLGSNREWSWTLLAVALGGLTVVWAMASLLQPRRISLSVPLVPAVLFLGVCGWVLVQGSTGTPPDWHHPLWSLNSEVLDAPLDGSITLARDDTATALLRLLSYGLAFFLALQLCRDPKRARTLFLTLAGVGVFGAVYGLIVYWGELDTFLFAWPFDYRKAVHGTFVNRNHFATWLGLNILCLLAVFYQGVAIRRNPVYRVPVDREVRLEQFLLKTWKPLAALIIMTAALILTHSRGGFLATAAGGLTLLLLLNHRQRIESKRSRLVLATAVGFALAAFFLTNEVLLKRMDQSTAGMEGRMQAYELAQDGIDDNPVLGFGYGTFADSFRLYRDETLSEFFDKAHNTYLENIFELGWPAALALFLAVAWLGVICYLGVRRRGRDWVFPATAVSATVLVAVHALVDFSIQMPATAVTFAAILGAGVAQSRSSRPSA